MTPKPRTIEMNDRFRHALHLMEHTNRCLFLTGEAGTGKSTLLSHFCARTSKKPVVLAPTGVAALNVKGQTIHKFFNFYIDVTPDKIRRRQIKPRNPKLYAKLKTIIIDEVSMVRADMLDCIDEFLRLYGPKENQPFGGVQMIFVGDLYQLPPVVNRESEEIFAQHYETPYFFSARCLKETDFAVVELNTIYRQKDAAFVGMLNRIRNNTVTDADIEELNSRYQPLPEPKGKGFSISLTTTNRKADEINAEHLAALKGKQNVTNARIDGDFTKEYYPTATELQFKIGAQIMLINNDTQGRWVNGSIGVITATARDADDRAYVSVRLKDEDEIVHVYPHTWEVYRYALEGSEIAATPIGSFTQFPFRLAWAVTIHKSQGKTFEQVVIDIDRGTFAAGQIYVALSRCTTFEGIVLTTRIQRQHISADERIVEFLRHHAYEPEEIELAEGDALLDTEIIPDARDQQREALETARRTVRKLAEGINPITGEALPEGAPYNHPHIVGALIALLEASEAPLATGKKSKDKPKREPRPGLANAGKAWSPEHRQRVTDAFAEGLKITAIAKELERSYGSIRSELIRQGVIAMDELDDHLPEAASA